MLIYRLEHRSSGLGPFEHRSSRQKTPSQDALKGIRKCTRSRDGSFTMADISELPVVKELLKRHPKAVFGWTCQDKYLEFILDNELLHRYGFRHRIYHVESPLYISDCKQALFLKPPTFTLFNMNVARTVKLVNFPKLHQAVVYIIEDNHGEEDEKNTEEMVQFIEEELAKAGHVNLTLETADNYLRSLSEEAFQKFIDGEIDEHQTEIERITDEVLDFVMDKILV